MPNFAHPQQRNQSQVSNDAPAARLALSQPRPSPTVAPAPAALARKPSPQSSPLAVEEERFSPLFTLDDLATEQDDLVVRCRSRALNAGPVYLHVAQDVTQRIGSARIILCGRPATPPRDWRPRDLDEECPAGITAQAESSATQKPKKRKRKRLMAERVCDRAAENLGISHLLPARPNKPVSAYFEYLRAVRLEFSRNNPALSKTQAKISQVAAKRWKESEQERVPYVAQYEKNREAHSAAAAEYRAKLETFQETPVGQQWIAEQGRIRKRHHESTFDDELEELYAEEGVRQLRRDLPQKPVQPKLAVEIFVECLWKRLRKKSEEEASSGAELGPDPAENEVANANASTIYYQLSKEERAPYEEMANWSMEHYLDAKKDFRRDMKTIRALAEAMVPNKLEKIIDGMIENVTLVWKGKEPKTKDDMEWFEPGRQRLVRHQLTTRVLAAVRAGVTPQTFFARIRSSYTDRQRQAPAPNLNQPVPSNPVVLH